MWTPELVRIRFIEAAATERFLPKPRNPDARGYWPEFLYNQEDRDGWDQQAKDDHMEIWQGRGAAKADALSRYQECLVWTIERLTDPQRRQLVWAFAFCRAYKRDFGKLCKKRGWVKTTAYNRLNRVWENLAFDFHNEAVLLRLPADSIVRQESHPSIEITPTLKDSESNAAPHIHPPFVTEKPTDTLKTPEAMDAFISHLEDVNSQRRKALVRRFRKAANGASADAA